MDFYGFYTGKEFSAYEFLGAHLNEKEAVFRTFAPGAASVSLIGDFNGWQEQPMVRIYDGNFWEGQAAAAEKGQRYKYRIRRQDGSYTDHSDPYGFFAEKRPNTASVLWPLNGCSFHDRDWMKSRAETLSGPLNIYEMHCGSWRKKTEEADGWYSYRELAPLLIPYLKETGYNYVQLLPLSEHPCDESWGYQSTGFYSPTSRYGNPDDLRCFVDLCHQNGIGVILDFVPVHFSVNDYALARYDGTPLYEYPHRDVGESEWGSCNFMHSRGEVRSFLQSSAYYWLKEFHMDGLRMDAVSRLIYWQGMPERGENAEGIQFLRFMNAGLKERIPQAILIAEDSSSFPGVTLPAEKGGLGFDYKWDLGWMNDTLSYFQSPPEMRPELYHRLTFSMMYFSKERYLLPLSHDEVVHGKATILQKMNGNYEDKFPQGRALFLYMTAHPGKKLSFMGNELGQLREWDEKREQDWNLLSYPIHDAFFRFIKDLNRLYLDHPAFFQDDYRETGFRWLDCRSESRCIYAFERRSKKERLIFLFNFSNRVQADYRPDLPREGSLTVLLHSDWQTYGGSTVRDDAVLSLGEEETVFSLPAFSGVCLLLRNGPSSP